MSLLQDASKSAESTAPLCAEGEIASPLSGLPRGAGSHGNMPETYTVSYTCTLTGDNYIDFTMTYARHYLTQNQVVATSCWFESGQGHQSDFADFIEGSGDRRAPLRSDIGGFGRRA
jgi:hypothetical protein